MADEFIPDVLNLPDQVRLVSGFLSALIITWVSIPSIVKVSKFKKLYDFPNERTSHSTETPTLGGLAVFAGFALSIVIFTHPSGANEFLYILGGLISLFFIGIKDDIMTIDPKKKIIGQVIASLIIVCIGGIRITNFHNAFGVGAIPPLISIIFTIFLFLVLINGFNLIDGIDGLASAIGFLTSLLYGIWFILDDQINYGILCFSLCGGLIAFFRFNVFGKQNKIFLGDTGSMIIGFVVAVITVKFLECELIAPPALRFNAAPAISISLLMVPLFDSIRVFLLRIMNGKSPFKADRNHIHHMLLSLGLSHLQVTITMISVTLLFIITAILMQAIGNLLILIIMALIALFLSFIPARILRNR